MLCVELDPFLYDDEISGREGVDVPVLVDDLGGIGFFVMTLRTTGPPEPGFFWSPFPKNESILNVCRCVQGADRQETGSNSR